MRVLMDNHENHILAFSSYDYCEDVWMNSISYEK